ncbi:acetyl-CoA synthetase, partial [Paracoccus thiocyanatus]
MSIENVKKHPIPAGFSDALVGPSDYARLYAESISDPEGFWGREGRRLDWIQPYSKVKDTDFTMGRVSVKWFEDGVLNASVNCIDRHLAERAGQTAIIFEPDDPDQPARHITYAELSEKVNRFANVLLSQGVMRGDRVVIYLPMIPEAAYAMLACARIGAIHSIVFA